MLCYLGMRKSSQPPARALGQWYKWTDTKCLSPGYTIVWTGEARSVHRWALLSEEPGNSSSWNPYSVFVFE